MNQRNIDWKYQGKADPLCGTGATNSEFLLAHGSATMLTILLLSLDRIRETPIATGWHILLFIFFAYDIAGGAVANMLNSCKRYYHSPLQTGEGTGAWLAKNVRVFTAIHVQPILAAYLFGGNVRDSVAWYVVLQISVSVIMATPLYLRRALATNFTLVALLLNEQFPVADGLAWFIPCLFIKMLIGHAVREEPYRPERQDDKGLERQ